MLSCMGAKSIYTLICFFFQAEDGIRDTSVTGVQTCALPIFLARLKAATWVAVDTEADSLHAYPEKVCLIQISITSADELIDSLAEVNLDPLRSEERRVGKECRSGWAWGHDIEITDIRTTLAV